MQLDFEKIKMGKKNRLSRLINKWLKSDLPDDNLSATVLLLGVTRIPTSPAPTRRVQLSATQNNPPSFKPKSRKNSISSSRRNSFKVRKNTSNFNLYEKSRTVAAVNENNKGKNGTVKRTSFQNPEDVTNTSINPDSNEFLSNLTKPQKRRSQFLNKLFSNSPLLTSVGQRNSFRGITDSYFVTRKSSEDTSCLVSHENFRNIFDDESKSDVILLSNSESPRVIINDHAIEGPTPFATSNTFITNPSKTIMDRSVDSIGTCSLDVEGSVNYADQSDQSSTATLKSIHLSTSPQIEPHLPSYLSLACTVNGYSTTTNYNSDRLSKSRDVSPHRILDGDLTGPYNNEPVADYTVRNNLLSPPTVVPLPITKTKRQQYTKGNGVMANHSSMSHHEYFSTSSRIFYQTHESKSSYMGHYTSKCFSGATSTSDANTRNTANECKNETETKSFIQQRVERLYGPGALAQGFFISKRLQGRSFEAPRDNVDLNVSPGKHSASFDEGMKCDESHMKQSSSSPTLPVLRHLRPEFRAQLPIISPKKSLDSVIQKGNASLNLKEESKKNGGLIDPVVTNGKKINGHEDAILFSPKKLVNGKTSAVTRSDETVKDGHYFLKILDAETERLLQLAGQIENELENLSLSEEIKGKLRSASGKARLLTSQKMQQFRGLCANNISRSENEAFPTTNEDLQGFWDMVLLQVDQVNEIFKEIDELRANNWVEKQSQDVVDNGMKKGNGVNGVTKSKKVSKPVSVASQEARKQRDAQRKQMIEARRKAMKEQKNIDNIQIFVPESS